MQANKSLGQHFLKDKTIINKICNDHSDLYDVIVEVGPGPGALSAELSKKNKPLFFIEKDTRFIEGLKDLTLDQNIFNQDALEFDWKNFIKENKLESKSIWLVSNLPYNVGTVLFTQFLQIKNIQYMTLMFQKEVGDKTYLRNIKNEMCGILFLSLNYMNSNHLCKVMPGAFNPPPKVNSTVVSYNRRSDSPVKIDDYEKLNSFLRKLFSQKRKKISHALKQYSCFHKIKNDHIINIDARAESLAFDDILSLFEFIDNNNSWE